MIGMGGRLSAAIFSGSTGRLVQHFLQEIAGGTAGHTLPGGRHLGPGTPVTARLASKGLGEGLDRPDFAVG